MAKYLRQSITIERIQAPIIPVVGEWIQNSPDTLSLGQGMVAYPPPPSAFEAIRHFGNLPEHHLYGSVLGAPTLLNVIESKLRLENNLNCDQGYRIMVTAGSNMAFLNVILAITDPGDEVILPRPYYFNQEMAIRMRNCVPVEVATDEHFHLQLAAIRAAITDKTRAIVTVSPNNPSGAVYPEADLRAVNNLCREYGLYHISDEAYEYFTYADAEHFSPGSIENSAEHTILLYSLSKAYGFASWRIGYMVFPEALLSTLLKIQDTNLICPPLITQYAAIGALSAGADYCKSQVLQLAKSRDYVLNALLSISDLCEISSAEGAFYFLIKLHSSKNALEIVKCLINEYKIAVIPGTAFGLQTGCYLRVSYGMLTDAKIEMAMQRLVTGIKALC